MPQAKKDVICKKMKLINPGYITKKYLRYTPELFCYRYML